MKRFLLILFLMASLSAQAAYVNISTLTNMTLIKPANPVSVSGKVISESPLIITDGRGTISLSNLTAKNGDFLFVTGNWDGSSLSRIGVSGVTAYIGLASTEMVYVPAGSFLMGNSGTGWEDILDYAYNLYQEKPQHSVYLSAYYIGKYELTRGEYKKFMDAGGYSNPAYWSIDGWSWKTACHRTEPVFWNERANMGGGYYTQTDRHPVMGVSYYEAEAFCNWAGLRLPTEAEWEKASRWTGDHPNIYSWGDVWDKELCNNYYDTNPAAGGYNVVESSAVGIYSNASPYQCMDMMGNLSEWCSDWYSSNYYSETPTGGWVNPEGPTSGTQRVTRGGNFVGGNKDCRCAERTKLDPAGSGAVSVGIRVVCPAP